MRNIKILYVVTAVVEAVGGLALLASPSEVIAMLFGVVFDTPIKLAVGRMVYGLEGVAFWPAAVLHTAMTAWCIACLVARS